MDTPEDINKNWPLILDERIYKLESAARMHRQLMAQAVNFGANSVDEFLEQQIEITQKALALYEERHDEAQEKVNLVWRQVRRHVGFMLFQEFGDAAKALCDALDDNDPIHLTP